MGSVAICRSPYHVELLRLNAMLLPQPLTFLMLTHLGIEFGVFVGEEVKEFSVGSIRKNKQYYRDVLEVIQSSSPEKIVMFNTYTPLAKYLLDRLPLSKFELWEDGLNHYINEHNGVVYYAKSAVKSVLGYYSGESLRVYSRKMPFVRDRFGAKNLFYPRDEVHASDRSVVYIGQPLVEDGMVSKRVFSEGLDKAFEHVGNRRIEYLPHPRESVSKSIVAERFGESWDLVNLRSLGYLSAEDFLKDRGCSVCMSAFSTVNFNVSLPVGKNVLIPSYMRLHRIKRKIERMGLEDIEVI